MKTVTLLTAVVLMLGTWPMFDFAAGQPPGYACPYGYYFASDGYCYPAPPPAYAYYPPPVYAPPVYQPPAVYDGFGIGLGFGFRFGGAERGRGDRDRERGERERGHR